MAKCDLIFHQLRSERFGYGFNAAMGDKGIMFRGKRTPLETAKDSPYYSRYALPRFTTMFDDFPGILHGDNKSGGSGAEAKK